MRRRAQLGPRRRGDRRRHVRAPGLELAPRQVEPVAVLVRAGRVDGRAVRGVVRGAVVRRVARDLARAVVPAHAQDEPVAREAHEHDLERDQEEGDHSLHVPRLSALGVRPVKGRPASCARGTLHGAMPPRRAPHVVVLTGAGVSQDSGVPTFRDAGGLWEGTRVEDVATPEAWARDPAFVWRFYQLRRAALARVLPNAAHVALARLQRELGARGVPVTLVSQNVDDLHRRAGAEVIDMHGQLRRLRCDACGARAWNELDVDPARFVPCAACGNPRLRPDVVWFGEVPYELDRIGAALSRCTRFLAVGTSGAVYPAAGFLAHARVVGAACTVNALEAPENLGAADTFLPGRAVEVIPPLVERWLAELAP